jgi:phosphoribosylglycinamide formyltransferase-1
MQAPLKLGVLVSGSGSNLAAILEAIGEGRLNAEVCVVLSNRAEAFALERARRAGIPTAVVSPKGFEDRQACDAAMIEELRRHAVDWVVLAGFMRLLTPVFLSAYIDRIVNIHPALLPAFPGVDAQKQALDYGVKVTGCTVHFVDAGVDTGPIIAQEAVAVEPAETLESLKEKLHRVEHRLLPSVLIAIAEGRVRWVEGASGRRVEVG